MKNPLVSIIIPAYNAEKYIGKCLDSILTQTMRDFEVLVIDDGSSDKTGEVVKNYVKEDKRVKYLKQKNMGVARTRNKAVGLVKGEFVAFIDNDDFIDEDYLEKMLPKKNEDIVICGYRRPNRQGKIINETRLKDANWSKFIVMAPWAKVYRKKLILDYGLKFLDNNIGEDVYFNIIAMLVTNKIRVSEYVGYNWFYNEKSVSNTKQRSFEDMDVFKLLDSCYDELEKRGLVAQNSETLSLFFYRYIVWFLLFAVKGQSKTKINKIYDQLFDWLGRKFPDYQKNRLLKGELPGEIERTRKIYKIFSMAQKLGLGKILVWGYAKI